MMHDGIVDCLLRDNHVLRQTEQHYLSVGVWVGGWMDVYWGGGWLIIDWPQAEPHQSLCRYEARMNGTV